MNLIYLFPCREILHFKTKRCADHTCIVKPAPHEDQKHECACGLKWTKDPELAGRGKQWSREQVIWQGDRFGQPLNPTQDYNRNDDEEPKN
jgi:hypothetical protein